MSYKPLPKAWNADKNADIPAVPHPAYKHNTSQIHTDNASDYIRPTW